MTWLDNLHPALRRAWHPVARSADISDGGLQQVELCGETWVLTRLSGRLVALRDRCPHRLAPLSAGEVVGDTIQCPYHGYRFDGDGRCVEIPALGPTAAIPPKAWCDRPAGLSEHLGLIWLAPETPLTPLPQVPEFDDPTFTVVPLPPWDWTAGAAQMADNFLDVAHFPFTHRATFGDPADRRVAPYEVERVGWTFTVTHRHTTKALDASIEPGASAPVVPREMHFECTAPHHVRLRISYPVEDVVLTILFFHQPLDRRRTRLWCVDMRNDIADGRATIEETMELQRKVGEEDRWLLEQFRSQAVPLDLTEEVHTRADRITLELRRMLGDLVEAASTPVSSSATNR